MKAEAALKKEKATDSAAFVLSLLCQELSGFFYHAVEPS
jgi:hypothetical protein